MTIILPTLRAAPAHHQAQPLWRAGATGTTGKMSMGSNICSAPVRKGDLVLAPDSLRLKAYPLGVSEVINCMLIPILEFYI
jgi:hypothetical protein